MTDLNKNDIGLYHPIGYINQLSKIKIHLEQNFWFEQPHIDRKLSKKF